MSNIHVNGNEVIMHMKVHSVFKGSSWFSTPSLSKKPTESKQKSTCQHFTYN